MESGSASPLGRKGRGSHPVPGSGLKQRDGQRENVGTGFKPVHSSRIKTFVNNHLLDPDFFLGGRRMNFHKTIGFLATLLLVFGLGVPDSYAQAVESVSITLNPSSIVDTAEETTVTATVSATLASAATSNMAVTVSVSDITTEEADDNDATAYGTITAFDVELIFAEGQITLSGTGTFVVNPSEDGAGDSDDEVVQIQAATGTGATEKTATANLTIQEAISSITLSLDPNSFVDTADATTVTADVMVTLNEAPSADTEVIVTLTDITDPDGADGDIATPADNIGNAESGDYTFTAGDPVTVTVDMGTTSGTAEGTFTFTPAADDDDDAETVVIQAANADAGQSVRANLTITELISSIALTLSPDSFEEGTTTSVLAEAMVTLNAAASSAIAVTVAVADITDADGADGDVLTTADNIGTAESGDYATITTFNIVVNIPSDSRSGSGRALFSFEPSDTESPADDDSEVVVLEAAAAGHMGRDMLTISEGAVEEITLTLTPDSVVETAGETTVTAAVTVTLNSEVSAATTVMVSLSSARGTAEAGDYTIGTLDDIELIFDPAGTPPNPMEATGSVTFTFDPNKDAEATDDETVLITATALEVDSEAATLTITDDGVSAGTIKITTSLDEIREDVRAEDVVVTASLVDDNGDPLEAPAGGVMVTVTFELIGNEGTEDEPVTTTVEPKSITIQQGATEGSVTVSINPADDNVFTSRTIQVKGSSDAAGYVAGTADIKVLDEDSTNGEIAIAAAPPSVTVGSTGNSVKLTIDVTAQTDTPIGTMVTVSLMTDAGKLSSDAAGANVVNEVVVTLGKDPRQDPETYRTRSNDGDHTKSKPQDRGGIGIRGVVYLTVDGGSAPGVVATVTATSDEYTAATRTISAFNRDAQDVSGYRVLVNKSNQWVPGGDKKVVVSIVRIDELALAWTAFDSIKVALYDTTTVWNNVTTGEIEVGTEVALTEINNQDGKISFKRAGAGSAASPKTNPDRIEISVQVPVNNGPRDNPAPSGQYLGVYAAADFVLAGTTTRLTNRQSDKPVFPNPAIVADLVPNEADRVVGDGKIFWVDNVKPGNTAIAIPRVTSEDKEGNEEVDSKIVATLDDELRVAIAVNVGSGRARFDIADVQVQLITQANTAYLKGKAIPSKTRNAKTLATFKALDVVNASGDSLYTSTKVTPGLFKSQTDQFVEGIGKIDTPFEGDDMDARVRARVRDQAGNASGWRQSPLFDADSRAPKVLILYPSADPDSIYEHTHPLRFTGKVIDVVEGQNVDAHLNPLAVHVDEPLSKLEVFAVGADTMVTIDGRDVAHNDSSATYNTSALTSPKKKKAKDVHEEDEIPDGVEPDDLVFVPSSKNVGGTEIELAVLATDLLGNTTHKRRLPVSRTMQQRPDAYGVVPQDQSAQT